MPRGLAALPRRRIALWGLVLHALWEFGQCTLLYNMWEWGFWRATVWMWGAIAGDVVITLGVALGAAWETAQLTETQVTAAVATS